MCITGLYFVVSSHQYSDTPLDCASLYGYLQVVRLLTSRGAKLNATNGVSSVSLRNIDLTHILCSITDALRRDGMGIISHDLHTKHREECLEIASNLPVVINFTINPYGGKYHVWL